MKQESNIATVELQVNVKETNEAEKIAKLREMSTSPMDNFPEPPVTNEAGNQVYK
jgi:hypothetical protein